MLSSSLKQHFKRVPKMHSGRLFSSVIQSETKCAVVFPGQGTQKVGMCKEFLEHDWSREFLNQCDQRLDFSITNLMAEGPKETLDLTEYAQPSIFIQSYLKYQHAKQTGEIDEKNVEYLFGHSLGEYNETALVAAESLDPLEVVKLLKLRGKLMQECCQGKEAGMYVVLSDYNKVSALINEVKEQYKHLVCDIASINSPKQFIISGELEVLNEVRKELKSQKIASAKMNVSAAFHSSLLIQMKDEFREALNKLSYSPPSKSVIRNFDVKMYSNKEDIIEGLVEQINNTVLFRKTLDFCLSQGIKKYIDVGEEGIITTIIKQNASGLDILKLGSAAS